MPLIGDHYAGVYADHAVELIRNNWDKTLKLLIDGEVVASTTCHFPRTITLTASLEHQGVWHEVVARSLPRHFIFTTDTIEVDGHPLSLLHEAPKAAPPGWVIVLIIISGVALLLAAGGVFITLLR